MRRLSTTKIQHMWFQCLWSWPSYIGWYVIPCLNFQNTYQTDVLTRPQQKMALWKHRHSTIQAVGFCFFYHGLWTRALRQAALEDYCHITQRVIQTNLKWRSDCPGKLVYVVGPELDHWVLSPNGLIPCLTIHSVGLRPTVWYTSGHPPSPRRHARKASALALEKACFQRFTRICGLIIK